MYLLVYWEGGRSALGEAVGHAPPGAGMLCDSTGLSPSLESTAMQPFLQLNIKIGLSHHHTTNFLNCCRPSRNLKLGTQLKEDMKK